MQKGMIWQIDASKQKWCTFMAPKETVLSSFGAVKLAPFGGYEVRWGLTRQKRPWFSFVESTAQREFSLRSSCFSVFGAFSDLSATGT